MAKKKIKKNPWSKRELALLKKLYGNNPTAKIASRFGRKSDAVKKKASRMGLRKTKKYMKTLGRAK